MKNRKTKLMAMLSVLTLSLSMLSTRRAQKLQQIRPLQKP